MPYPVKNSAFLGSGCFVQGAGIACGMLGLVTIATLIGPLILWPLGLALAIKGGRMSYWHECSDCGTKLANGNVTVCPGCKQRMGGK